MCSFILFRTSCTSWIWGLSCQFWKLSHYFIKYCISHFFFFIRMGKYNISIFHPYLCFAFWVIWPSHLFLFRQFSPTTNSRTPCGSSVFLLSCQETIYVKISHFYGLCQIGFLLFLEWQFSLVCTSSLRFLNFPSTGVPKALSAVAETSFCTASVRPKGA